MSMESPKSGAIVSGLSALLLLCLMFFHWYGVELVNTSDLLFQVESAQPGKSAWAALGWISAVLALAVGVSLIDAMLRIVGVGRKLSVVGDVAVFGLGILSVALMVFRLIEPPVFFVEGPITSEGAVEPVMFVALVAAVGIAVGGWLGLRDDKRSCWG